jgi:hypothetical protein
MATTPHVLYAQSPEVVSAVSHHAQIELSAVEDFNRPLGEKVSYERCREGLDRAFRRLDSEVLCPAFTERQARRRGRQPLDGDVD